MSRIDQSGTFTLGDRTVKRLGYGAMQLAGPGVFGPPKDHDAALAVREAATYPHSRGGTAGSSSLGHRLAARQPSWTDAKLNRVFRFAA